MKQENLVVKTRKKKKYSSYKGEITPAVSNVIERDFHSDKPNQKWLTDITEFAILAGKVYLSPIIDCFDGMLTCWEISTSPDSNLVNTRQKGSRMHCIPEPFCQQSDIYLIIIYLAFLYQIYVE